MYTRLRKCINPYLQKDHVRHILGSGIASMAVSTVIGTAKNYMVWHFGLSRNPENEFAWQFAKQM